MKPKNGNPGAGGAGASKVRSPNQQNNAKVTCKTAWLEVTWGASSMPIRFRGRQAQTLYELIQRGSAGLTSGEASPLGWARRTSAYVHKLRKAGLTISTTCVSLPGGVTIGRYVLKTVVVVVTSHGL